MKNLFVITSSIASGLQSFYSLDERFAQTMQTIESVRKIDGATILFVENSDVVQYENAIRKEVDIFIKLLHNPSKSGGELLLVRSALKHVLDNDLSFDMIYKLSGRYHLTDKFKLIDDKRISFRNFGDCVSTVLYSFGDDKIDDVLACFEDIAKRLHYKDIEHATFEAVKEKDINWVEYWGVIGNRSPDGSFLEH
jgi:hypothetical protein